MQNPIKLHLQRKILALLSGVFIRGDLSPPKYLIALLVPTLHNHITALVKTLDQSAQMLKHECNIIGQSFILQQPII